MTADQMNATWEAFETNRDRFLQEIAAVKDRGEREGIRYLHREDRFEMRSRRGQELNRELEWARSMLSDVQEQIGVAREPDGLRLLIWANALGTWYRRRAFLFALIVALLTCVGVSIVWETYSYVNQHQPVQALIWNPAPVLIRGGVVFGAQLGWLSGFLALSLLLRYYLRVAAGKSNGQYLEEAYSSVNDYEEAEDGSGATPDSGTQAIPDPYEILSVSREASIEELKNAYRDAIKRCHPDTVAGRSKIIRDAAEAEAQQINSAYEMIRNERGFK